MPGSVGCGVSGKRRVEDTHDDTSAMSGFRVRKRPAVIFGPSSMRRSSRTGGADAMSEFAPGNASTPAVEGAIATPILAHTNGGDAMPVSGRTPRRLSTPTTLYGVRQRR